MEQNKQPIYPIEPWSVTETEFSMETNYRNETTFSLSNGYLGTRGTLEEGYEFSEDEGLEGNFINGFYESEHIRYGEWNFGFPLTSQSLLNLPDCKRIRLRIGDEELDIRKGKTENYRRTLHMDRGIVTRSFTWTSESGKTVRVRAARLVSFHCKNLMEMCYQVTPVNFSGELTLISCLNAEVENHTRKTNPLVDYGPFGRHLEPDCLNADGPVLYYEGSTKNSGLTMACGCSHRIRLEGGSGAAGPGEKGGEGWELAAESLTEGHGEKGGEGRSLAGESLTEGRGKKGEEGRGREAEARAANRGKDGCDLRSRADGLRAQVTMTAFVREGAVLTLEKQIAYASCLDMEPRELKPFILKTLKEAEKNGWEYEAGRQQEYVRGMWKKADVKIKGDDALQQGIRFNLFHILQSASRDGRTGMGAKGLSGEGYEGHYFWDTEMYVIPVLVYTNPELAKSLLSYRYRTLDKARKRARALGHEKGALYPWRTINGEEASTYFPLGTAQYHINADISYAFKLYVDAAGDMEFLKEQAAEVLAETARVWADVGCFAESRGGKYCICAVTGPDEYNAIVDNNFYTNLMARENLRDAGWALDALKKYDLEAYQALEKRIGLKEEERVLWGKIADNMYFPYDENRKIYPLDDGFMQRKPWDDSRIPPEKRHLLYENYHPLFIFRQRMSKQADAILGMYLHSDLFTEEELKRNYDFYQEVTLHHSSLSTCIFGSLASRIGYHEEAYRYFSQSARMDLDDCHNNFYAGIHAANMAGTWQAIVNGFGGLRISEGRPELAPMLPEAWNGYEFCVSFKGCLLKIEVERERVRLGLLEGGPVGLRLYGKEITLKKEGDWIEENTQGSIL